MSTIAVVGSVNMDLVVHATRFPTAGETVTGGKFATIAGGKGANQAVAAKRLGGRVTLVAAVGADEFAATLQRGLIDEGIDVTYVGGRAGHASGVALITVDAAGENTIVVVPGANGALSVDDVDAARDAIAGAQVLLLQLEVPLPTVIAAARLAGDAGATVVLNAAPAATLPDTLLALAEFLVVNESEFAVLAGGESTDRGAAARSLQARGARNVVLTLGSTGVVLFAADGRVTTESGIAVDVVDTTAAGDAFVGGFAVALADGLTADEALRRGNAAGALAVTRHGAQPSLPTRGEVDALLAARR